MGYEALEKWVPDEAVGEVYDLEDLGWEENGFFAVLIPDNLDKSKNPNHKIKFLWDRVFCYMVTEESYRPDVWISDPEEAWAFYRGIHSRFLDYFQKDNILSPDDILHYALIGTNLILDVISSYPPKVELLPL